MVVRGDEGRWRSRDEGEGEGGDEGGWGGWGRMKDGD